MNEEIYDFTIYKQEKISSTALHREAYDTLKQAIQPLALLHKVESPGSSP